MSKMTRGLLCASLILTAVMALGRTPLPAHTGLEQYIEIDLARVEEAYRLIDTFGEEVWPGWKNDMKIEFMLQYPNLVFVIVAPEGGNAPSGYELVRDRNVRGRSIYINRKDELPIKLQPPLVGGGKGGMRVRIMLQETGITAKNVEKAIKANKKKKDPGFCPPCDSEGQILLICHEFFHGFQTTVVKPREDRGREGRNFQVTPEYSTYSNIEGLALRNAFLEKDRAKALACLKDYITARSIKRNYMPEAAALNEAEETVSEGTANYSNTRLAMLIRDGKYKTKMRRKTDPFFYGYKYIDGYIYQKTLSAIEYDMGNTLDTLGKCYNYGVVQCFLLDRLFPGWKNGFFQSGATLDEVTEKYLKLSDTERKAIAAGFKTRYKYDELYAKHAAVIKDRDETMAIVNSRQGKRYIIDFKKTKDFIIPQARGRNVRLGVEVFYANGIEEFRLGDIVLTTADTPLYQPRKNFFSLEWVDTAAKPGVKGHTFKYGKQEGDVYKDVEFKTAGFTLKAPEVQIVEDEAKNEVTVVIVRKVAK